MAIMAPTSILASQHLESFTGVLGKFGIKCELLISNILAKKKREILEKIEKRRNRRRNSEHTQYCKKT